MNNIHIKLLKPQIGDIFDEIMQNHINAEKIGIKNIVIQDQNILFARIDHKMPVIHFDLEIYLGIKRSDGTVEPLNFYIVGSSYLRDDKTWLREFLQVEQF